MRLFPLLCLLARINASQHHHEVGENKDVFIKATEEQMKETKRLEQRDRLRGKRRKRGRVVGGTDVTSPSEFPFYVILYSSKTGNPWCGGTILDAYTILTAAHCTNPKFIKSGSVERSNQHDGHWSEVLKCQSHAQSKVTNKGCWNMDYQVCRLKQPIPLDNVKTKPAQLGTKAEYDQYVSRRSGYSDMCQVVGTGRAGAGGTKVYKPKVQKAFMGVDNSSPYKSFASICGTDIILKGRRSKTGACNGDSGGPLTCMIHGQPKVFGVAAWAVPSCDSWVGYSPPYNVLSWIEQTTKSLAGSSSSSSTSNYQTSSYNKHSFNKYSTATQAPTYNKWNSHTKAASTYNRYNSNTNTRPTQAPTYNKWNSHTKAATYNKWSYTTKPTTTRRTYTNTYTNNYNNNKYTKSSHSPSYNSNTKTINTQQLKAQLSKAKIELTGLQDGLTQLQQLLYYNTSPQQLKNQMSQIKDQQVSLQNALNQMAMITG